MSTGREIILRDPARIRSAGRAVAVTQRDIVFVEAERLFPPNRSTVDASLAASLVGVQSRPCSGGIIRSVRWRRRAASARWWPGSRAQDEASSRRCRNSFSGRQLKKAPWSDISARPLASLCVGAPCARRGRHEIQERIGGRSPVEAERSVQ